ncbi:MAG: intermembrane phospholipid transport protein YdbH family protein [Verrucomicrobiota bacterium]
MSRNRKTSGLRGARSTLRRLWRTFVLGLLLLVLVVVAARPALHWAARSFVLSQLHDLGYQASSLGELRIGLTSCEVRNVLVSDGTGPGARIQRLDISYPFALPPRLDRVGIRISGADASVRETKSGWELDGVPIPPAAEEGAPEAAFPSLPVSFLEWSDVDVTVATRRFGVQRLTLEGRLQESGERSLFGEGAVAVGPGVHVRGRFRLDRLEGALRFQLSSLPFHARATSFGRPDTPGFATLGSLSAEGTLVFSEALAWKGQGSGSLEAENLFARFPDGEGRLAHVGIDRMAAHWDAADSAAESAFAGVDLEVAGFEASGRGHAVQVERLKTEGGRLPLPTKETANPAIVSPALSWMPTGEVDIRGLVVDGIAFSPWQFELTRKESDWRLRIPELRSPTFAGARLSDVEMRAPANLDGTWSAGGVAHFAPELVQRRIPADAGIELAEEGEIRFRAQSSVENAKTEGTIRTVKANLIGEALRLRWNGVDAQASFSTEAAAQLNGESLEANGTVELSLDDVDSQTVQLNESATLLVELPTIQAPFEQWLDWCRNPGTPPGGEALAFEVTAIVPHLQIPQRQLELADIHLSAPFVWNGGADLYSDKTAPGTLSAGSGRWLGRTLHIDPTTLRVADRSAEVAGAVSLGDAEAPVGQADVRATVAWNSEPSMKTQLHLRTSQLEKVRELAAQATGVTLPEPVELSGDVELAAEASFSPGHPLRTRGALSLRDIRLELEEPTVIVQGLSGEIELTDLIAVRTAAHQRVSFASALFGSIPVDGGSLAFQVESPDLLFLERCEMNWSGGTVTTHAVQVRPAEKNIELTLFVDGVELEELFQLQTLVKGKAEGRLYGQLPFRYRDGEIFFENGYLYSPPGISGRLQLDDAEALFAGLPKDSPRITVVKQTLKDMDYDYLRLDINTREELTPLKISLLGQARNDPTLRPVKLNANIESNINDLLDATRAMKRLNLNP